MSETENNTEDNFCELMVRCADLVGEYNGKLSGHQIGNALISSGVSLIMYTAPNRSLAAERISGCVANGIDSFKKNFE